MATPHAPSSDPATTTAFSRRSLLKLGALATGAVLLPSCASSARAGRPAAALTGKRVARFAHLTDFHVQPERHAGQGMAACLRHAQSLRDRPEFIVTGGDLVMDAYDQAFARTKEVFDLFAGTFRSDCSLPVHHTLGNHDIWGWNRTKSGLTGNEALFGKAYAVDRLGMADRYHSFDVGSGPGSWRIIVLDSVRPLPEDQKFGYEAFLDQPQMDWLVRTLEGTARDRWVCIVSHVPIVSAAALFPSDPKAPVRFSTSLMHADAAALDALFLRHPNVRLAISGHIHELDRVEWHGVTYICAGAVCGAWWKGRNKECDEGYSVVDLNDDGSFGWAYVKYGWKADPA